MEKTLLIFFLTRHLWCESILDQTFPHIVMCESLALCDYFTIPGMQALCMDKNSMRTECIDVCVCVLYRGLKVYMSR